MSFRTVASWTLAACSVACSHGAADRPANEPDAASSLGEPRNQPGELDDAATTPAPPPPSPDVPNPTGAPPNGPGATSPGGGEPTKVQVTQ